MPFYGAFSHIFFYFRLACLVSSIEFLKDDKIKIRFQKLIFKVILKFKSFLCPSSRYFKTDTNSMQHSEKSTLKECLIKRI